MVWRIIPPALLEPKQATDKKKRPQWGEKRLHGCLHDWLIFMMCPTLMIADSLQIWGIKTWESNQEQWFSRGKKKIFSRRAKNRIKTGNEIFKDEPTCNWSVFASTGVTFQLSKQMKPLAGLDRMDQQRGGNPQSSLITLNQFSPLTPGARHDRMPPSRQINQFEPPG